MAYSIAQYLNYASNFLGNAYECGNSGLFLYNKYVLVGRDFEMRDLLTIGGMLLNVTSIKFAHSNMRKGLNDLDKVPTRKVGPDYEGGKNSTVDRIRNVAQQSFDYAVNNPRKQGLNRMQLGKDAEIQATR